MTPDVRRRPRRADVRDRLLTAAAQLFSQHGYEQTSLDQVAATAGFTKGAVYSNFASKDDLFLDLMDSHIELRVRQVQEALARSADAASTGRVVGDEVTAALAEDRQWQLLFLDYVLRAARDPAVQERLVEHRHRVRSLITQAVREVMGERTARGGLDAEAVASAILALSNGLAIEQIASPGTVPDDLLGRLLQALQPVEFQEPAAQ